MGDEAIEKKQIKQILESLLFINEKPIEISELLRVTEKDKKEVGSALDELISEYEQRSSGISIVKVAGGYQMCSHPDNEPWVKKMYRERSKHKLSTAALESLAIIAYKQPITRMEIESIRGVNVDGVSRHLLNMGLIKTAGRKDVIGKPFLYITTRKFLEYFGLNSLRDLPKLEEFASLIPDEQVLKASDGNFGSGVEESGSDQPDSLSQETESPQPQGIDPAEDPALAESVTIEQDESASQEFDSKQDESGYLNDRYISESDDAGSIDDSSLFFENEDPKDETILTDDDSAEENQSIDSDETSVDESEVLPELETKNRET
ncbi:MAG: SMC-Scp complex subunit ScpB [Candidatus Omnitrophica bacterium]|nr:SMC-Scp complex subunit ScpB [Candidatus Omnitrophota bacterium]